MDKKIEDVENKVVDFWDKHNLTTRIVIVTFLVLLSATVAVGLRGGSEIKYFEAILDTLNTSILWLTLAVIAGVNSTRHILNAIIKYKTK